MPKGHKMKDLIVSVDEAFSDLPDHYTGGTSIKWTPEQDLAMLKHYKRAHKGKFIKRFREVYKHGSDKAMRRRWQYLESLFDSVDDYDPSKVNPITPN